jgi:tetratricopeptide (TPR) repeat protein
LGQGRFGAAIASMQRALQLAVDPEASAMLGHVYGRAGRRADAERIVSSLVDQYRRGRGQAYAVALVHAGLGDRDRAFDWLDKAFEDRSEYVITLQVDAMLDPLRSDPRFEGFLRRAGLAAPR